jgi:hypothetical protein
MATPPEMIADTRPVDTEHTLNSTWATFSVLCYSSLALLFTYYTQAYRCARNQTFSLQLYILNYHYCSLNDAISSSDC